MSEPSNTVETIEPAKTGGVPAKPDRPVKAEAGARPRGTSYVPKAPNIPKPPRKDEADDDDESFFQRNRIALIVGVVAATGAGWFFFSKPSTKSEPVRKAPEPQMVRLVMPPPPPPPPPPPKVVPPPPKDEKKVEMAPTEKPVEKAPVEKPAEKPPESLGTSIQGSGPGMGLSSGRGNGMIGGTGTGPGGSGSMAKWYAGQVGNKVAEALRNHRKTRSATMRVEAQVWLDSSGRITRAALDRSTGDAALDETLKNEVLPGIQLTEPPPKGMRMPIPLRLTARRPN